MAQKSPVTALTIALSGTWTSLWYYNITDSHQSIMNNLYLHYLVNAFFKLKHRLMYNFSILQSNNLIYMNMNLITIYDEAGSVRAWKTKKRGSLLKQKKAQLKKFKQKDMVYLSSFMTKSWLKMKKDKLLYQYIYSLKKGETFSGEIFRVKRFRTPYFMKYLNMFSHLSSFFFKNKVNKKRSYTTFKLKYRFWLLKHMKNCVKKKLAVFTFGSSATVFRPYFFQKKFRVNKIKKKLFSTCSRNMRNVVFKSNRICCPSTKIKVRSLSTAKKRRVATLLGSYERKLSNKKVSNKVSISRLYLQNLSQVLLKKKKLSYKMVYFDNNYFLVLKRQILYWTFLNLVYLKKKYKTYKMYRLSIFKKRVPHILAKKFITFATYLKFAKKGELKYKSSPIILKMKDKKLSTNLKKDVISRKYLTKAHFLLPIHTVNKKPSLLFEQTYKVLTPLLPGILVDRWQIDYKKFSKMRPFKKRSTLKAYILSRSRLLKTFASRRVRTRLFLKFSFLRHACQHVSGFFVRMSIRKYTCTTNSMAVYRTFPLFNRWLLQPYFLLVVTVVRLSLLHSSCVLLMNLLLILLKKSKTHSSILYLVGAAFKFFLHGNLAWVMENSLCRGARVEVVGKLDGVDRAKTFIMQYGAIPKSTFASALDTEYGVCGTIYGVLGITLWYFMSPSAFPQTTVKLFKYNKQHLL